MHIPDSGFLPVGQWGFSVTWDSTMYRWALLWCRSLQTAMRQVWMCDGLNNVKSFSSHRWSWCLYWQGHVLAVVHLYAG